MYNKKSKVSAWLAIATALLLIGFMILLPFLQYKTAEGDGLGVGIALIFMIIYGFPVIYLSSIPFVIVALIFGIKMLKQQSRKKLISLNVRMLITSIVLTPFLIFGFMLAGGIAFHSVLGLFPIIYAVLIALAYAAGIVAQIATIIILKKSPKEDAVTA
ncbi:MAG: hypothetical protein J1G05_04445 [Clostridiales bacterium]|nr:hypothetical protein [Clostridiales bacterium]